MLPGRDTGRTLWIFSHRDTAPPGDLRAWTGDPYTLRVHGLPCAVWMTAQDIWRQQDGSSSTGNLRDARGVARRFFEA